MTSSGRTDFLVRLFFAVLLAAHGAGAVAQQSYFQMYSQGSGLNFGEISAIAQDDTGFLWLGTHRGLVRFDGHEFLAYGRDRYDGRIMGLAYGPRDELLLTTVEGHGLRRYGGTIEALPGPNGGDVEKLASLDFDHRGALWAVIDGRLWRRQDASRWQAADGIPGDETPRVVQAIGSSVVVLTDKAAWRLRDGEMPRRLLAQAGLWRAAGDDDTLWLARHLDGGVWRITDDSAETIPSPPDRLIDMRLRGRTLWLAYDEQLIAVEPGGRQRQTGTTAGLPSGGPLLVDAEGSLWLGTFAGLVQFPEPDTWQWGMREGLPFPHAYRVAGDSDSVWVSVWGLKRNLVRIDAHSGELSEVDSHPNVCVIDGQEVWGEHGGQLTRWREGRMQPIAPLPQSVATLPQLDFPMPNCLRDATGARWFLTSQGIPLRLLADEVTLQSIAAPAPINLLWLDGTRIFAALDDRICALDLVQDGFAVQAADCTPSAQRWSWGVGSHVRTAGGTHWLGAEYDGVWALRDGAVRKLPGSVLREGGVVSQIAPGANGSVWLSGPGVLARATDCGACAAGLTLLETPGLWQGLPDNAAISAYEAGNGDLWVAGNRGVWRVPQSVRGTAHVPPHIVPVHVRIGAQEARAPSDRLELSSSQRQIGLEFAALSYRDRSLLRYRSRIDEHGEWSAPGRDSNMQLTRIAPGQHRIEMQASLDGEHWSAPAAVAFTALPKWYETLWARVASVVLLAAVLGLLYRLRVASLLRVQKERTRIAMDLHDEIGAGLGSIGILAGAATHARALDEATLIVRQIGDTAALLGGGLRSLVFSLRSGDATLAELGRHIGDNARRLFPDETPQLTLHLPAGDATRLRPDGRRHLLLFALEAMHNIARHAHARNVVVALEHNADAQILLSIVDDGAGFDSAIATTGAGLESMRRRATAIGGAFELRSAPGHGTRVAIRVPA
jgi:signal transduction histidine kinase